MTEAIAEEGESESYPVESPKYFSQSLIWELQRRYYDRHGIAAWAESRIPFSISTSPHIAAAYARVVFGFLRDWQSRLDPGEPVYIVEIGAGSGRLGFNFLRAMGEFFDQSVLRHIRFTYVLTDLVEKNVEFWEAHPKLRPFVEAGRLDFARFDAVNDTEMHLRHSGKVLKAGGLANPVIVLANYVFDTLPQDLFSFEDGEIFAVTAGLTSPQPEPDIFDPEIITRLELEYDRQPVTEDFYGDEHSARILRNYRESFESTVITFPQHALRCIDAFRRFAGDRMLLLSGDKGDHLLEEFQDRDIPSLTLHDTGFSIAFNYNAVVQYFENLGGEVLTTSFYFVSLNILAFLLGAPATTETRQAFRDFIDYNSPDDNFTALISLEKNADASLVELLAFQRMKRYDTHAFLLTYPNLAKKFNALPTSILPEIRRLVARLWDSYYEMNEKYNLPFYLGVMLAAISDYRESLPFFEESLARVPDHPTTLFNMANSYHHLGEQAKALALLDRLPEDQRERPEVRELRAKLSAGA